MTKTENVRISSAFVAHLRKLRDRAREALEEPRFSIEATIKAILHDCQVWRDGAEELRTMNAQAGAEFQECVSALLITLGIDIAAKREAERRLRAGEKDPFGIDHVAHWNSLSPEQRAGDLAVARLRVEATTGVNPLAPMKSLAQAEAWIADNDPPGMAINSAQANQRMEERSHRMAQKPPRLGEALADLNAGDLGGRGKPYLDL